MRELTKSTAQWVKDNIIPKAEADELNRYEGTRQDPSVSPQRFPLSEIKLQLTSCHNNTFKGFIIEEFNTFEDKWYEEAINKHAEYGKSAITISDEVDYRYCISVNNLINSSNIWLKKATKEK